MRDSRLMRFTLRTSGVALLITYAVFIPAMARGELPAHFTWWKVWVGPAMGFSVLPLIIAFGSRRSKSRPHA